MQLRSARRDLLCLPACLHAAGWTPHTAAVAAPSPRPARVSPPSARPCHSPAGRQASSAAEVEHLAGGAHLLQAAAWELRGSRHLSQAHALACLDAHRGTARAPEQCTALAQLATSVAAQHGYAAAEALLAAADERFPRSDSRVLAAARLAVAHDRALHRRDLHAAMDLATQMAALASPTDSVDILLRCGGLTAAALHAGSRGCTPAASTCRHGRRASWPRCV